MSSENIKPATHRSILSKKDLERFRASESYLGLVEFANALSQSVRGLSYADFHAIEHPAIQAIDSLIARVETLLEDTPPAEQATRFANPAFRLFLDKVSQYLDEAGNDQRAIFEYFYHSLGSRSRLDYGSGHELHFLVFLYAHQFPESTYATLVLRTFWRYLRLMRRIQLLYLVEPAGSHGVWGLDDYQHLPFLFGAAQLVDHPFIKPMSIHNPEILEQCSSNFMYLDQIRHINSTKPTVSLQWHSPLLNDISSAKSWAKIEAGMLLMYKDTVLGKLPIMQHLRFTPTLFPFPEYARAELTDEEWNQREVLAKEGEHQHVYAMGQELPTCCGMRLPASGPMVQGRGTRIAEWGDLRDLRKDRIPVD